VGCGESQVQGPNVKKQLIIQLFIIFIKMTKYYEARAIDSWEKSYIVIKVLYLFRASGIQEKIVYKFFLFFLGLFIILYFSYLYEAVFCIVFVYIKT